MNYAIVETGGKQYRVQPGDKISVEKIVAEEGSTVELDKVLLISQDATLTVGQPTVKGAKVLAEVQARRQHRQPQPARRPRSRRPRCPC